MNEFEVMKRETGESFGWVCGACKSAVEINARGRETAAACCTDKPADVCVDCGGAPTFHNPRTCNACSAARIRAKERAAYDKAKKVPIAEYDVDMFYLEGAGNEGYVNTDDWEDDVDGSFPDARPSWAWGTYEEKPTADLAAWVSEDVLQEHHEGACDSVDDKKIALAQTLLNEALAGVTTFYMDRSVVVLLPPREPDEDDGPERDPCVSKRESFE